MNKMISLACLLAVGLGWQTFSRGADWPTYMANNARAGSTAEELKLPLAGFTDPPASRLQRSPDLVEAMISSGENSPASIKVFVILGIG